jgi:hypothetical protein
MHNFLSRPFGKLISTTLIVLLLWLFTHVAFVKAGTQNQTIPTMPRATATRPTPAVSHTPTKPAPNSPITTQASRTPETQTAQSTANPTIKLVTTTPFIATGATATPVGVTVPLSSPSPVLTYTTTLSPLPSIEPVERTGSNVLAYIVIGLVLLFVIVIVVWMWLKRRKSK